jgi:hypothetical protein
MKTHSETYHDDPKQGLPGIDLQDGLFLLFLGLKLGGVIDWSWWLVFSPYLAFVVVRVLAFVVVGVVAVVLAGVLLLLKLAVVLKNKIAAKRAAKIAAEQAARELESNLAH